MIGFTAYFGALSLNIGTIFAILNVFVEELGR